MAWEVLTRFALAIVLDALAFVVWDVGTRPPLRLLRDLARGARVPAVLGRGLLRFALGAGLLVLGALVARPALRGPHAFTVLETGMLVAALIVEALIGNDLRAPLGAASAAGRNAKDSAEG
ncbi:MAG: hypothetical protein QOI11_2102 [Candidatus Eremiobacteraeota bacterium]|jgi:hypothetical protein|nr:hypothetical protein [Candidatus Eremiobacteraeota bacterium]